MTMTTRVHIAKPCDAEALFVHLLGILEADPSFVPSWERRDDGDPWRASPGPLSLGKATYRHELKGQTYTYPGGEFVADENQLKSTVGQGLAAILEVEYASDGPLVWPPHEWDEDSEERVDHGNTADPLREHLVSVDFDTAYGYKNGHGGGCDDLHAFLLNAIREWLAERDITEWSWHHEERGTWHEPDEIALRGDVEKGRP